MRKATGIRFRKTPFFVFYLLSLTFNITGASGTTVLINEIHTGCPDWVELVNAGNQPIDISGWRLRCWWKGLETFQMEEQYVFPEGCVLQPGEFTLVTDEPVFCCDSFHLSVFTWSDMEGICCVLETKAGAGIDSLVVSGMTGTPAIELPGGAEFDPPYPQRYYGNDFHRNGWTDTDSGADWKCCNFTSPCEPNPGQLEYTPGPEPVPAAGKAGITLLLLLFSIFIMIKSTRRVSIINLILFSISATVAHSVKAEFASDRVVIAIADGIRFEDALESDTFDVMPNINFELREKGTFCRYFYNNGLTITTAAHIALLTGVYIPKPNNRISRDSVFPEYPTIFEYFRGKLQEQGVPLEESRTRVCQIYGKQVECNNMAYSLHPAYGPEYAGRIRFPGWESGDTGPHQDTRAYLTALEEMDANHPELLLINFAQTDQRGHYGVRQNYEYSLRKFDEYAHALWKRIQTDEFYKNRTTMFILTDHGRHDDQHSGFRHHGCPCRGCRRGFLLAIGPDTPEGAVSDTVYDYRDLSVTISQMLDFEVPLSEGMYMDDIFYSRCRRKKEKGYDPESLSRTEGRSRHPQLTVSGENAAVVWIDDTPGDWKVMLSKSSDGGENWSEASVLPLNLENQKVQWADIGYCSDGRLFAAVSAYESASPESDFTCWKVHLLNGHTGEVYCSSETGQMGTPAEIFTDGLSMQCTWSFIHNNTELHPPYHGKVNVFFKDAPGILSRDSTATDEMLDPACPVIVRDSAFCHCAFQTFQDRYWNIGYCRSTDNGHTWEPFSLMFESVVPVNAHAPQLAVVDDHVVLIYYKRNLEDDHGNIVYHVSTNYGENWEETGLLSQDDDVYYTTMTSANGKIVAAWCKFDGQNSSLCAKTSTDGGISWSEEIVLEDGPGLLVDPDTAPVGNDLALLWADQSDDKSEIYFKIIPGLFE